MSTKPLTRASAGDETATSAELPFDADPRLVALLGTALSSEELNVWAGMPEPRRLKALQRIKALDRYCDEGSEITAKQAAIEAGVTLNRFYQMARVWPGNRLLSSVGAYGLVVKPRAGLKPHQNSSLQAVIRQVIEADANQGDSIAALARKLGQASNLPPESLPSKNTLRVFIEIEQRRRRDIRLAGAEVLFDLSATSLRRSDGRPHVAFFVIDGGTSLILGYATGVAERSAAGYSAAASMSLSQITTVPWFGSIWSNGLKRAYIVPGPDEADVATIISRLDEKMGVVSLELDSKGTRGQYIRRHLGLRLGSVRLLPSRTIPATTATGGVNGVELDGVAASSRIAIEVAEHNATILRSLNLKGKDNPPEDLVGLFQSIRL